MEDSDPAQSFATGEPVETITHEGKFVCMLIRSSPSPEATRFYTQHDLPIQLGKIVYPAGSEIPRHSHRPVSRNTAGVTEVLVVQKGRVIFDVYADDRTFLCSREMGVGDVMLQVAGGHGFRFAEDTVLLEVKQGPYQGDQEKEPF